MALPAHRIVAAPFACIGSVGAYGESPNIRKLLERFDIDYRLFTAGEHKSDGHYADENSDRIRDHLESKTVAVHEQFLATVERFRGEKIDLARVRTGDHWMAGESQALELGLVDEIQTSSEYLLRANGERSLVRVERKRELSGMLPNRVGPFLHRCAALLGRNLGAFTSTRIRR